MTVCICIFLYLLTKVGTILDFIRRLETVIPIEQPLYRYSHKNGGNHLCGGICGQHL